MTTCRKLLVVTLLATLATNLPAADAPADPAREPGAAMILSTGDNLFYYKWFPIDSPAGVGASFDIFKNGFNVDRIVWRGAQAQWMALDNVFRPESEEIDDLYKMEVDLEMKDRLSHKAAEEAKKRGMAYWAYMPFFEVGASAEAVSMSGLGPYNFEEKIRAERPDLRLYDRAGITSGSVVEFGYPEVRKAFLDRYEQVLKPGGEFDVYDGVIFYTYVENFFPRYSDQFIFSDIATAEYKKRYGVDVLTQPFDREKYLAIRGEYVTQYLRELRQVCNKYNKKLAFYIDAREPNIPQRWPSFPGVLVPGEVHMDWRTWVKEGLIDEIAVRSASTIEAMQPFLDATEGTNVKVSMLVNQMPANLRHLHARGVTRHIWSPELPSDFPKENRPIEDLNCKDRLAVLSVLRQIRDGQLDAPVEALTALFDHDDLMVRRQAVAAVLGRRMVEAIPALEKAAMDPENSFRCPVIDALGTLHGPNTAAVIGQSLEKYPVSGMRIVARTAWSAMMPERTADVIAVFKNSRSYYVRTAIAEMVVSKRAVPAIDATQEFRTVVEDAMSDTHFTVRSMGAMGAAYYPDRASVDAILTLLNDESEVVQNSAAFAAGELARRVEDYAARLKLWDALTARFAEYGSADSKRTDGEWGYRVAAEALIYGFGPRGERHVVSVLNGSNKLLADRAWRVLFHPNDGWNFYEVKPEVGEALYAYHPGPDRTGRPRERYSLPESAELISQTFASIEPDPTGVVGAVWEAGAKWSGMGNAVKFGNEAGTAFLELAVPTGGKGARVTATRAYDLPDGRFKNRLRGHFPSSPVGYALADGVVTVSFRMQRLGSDDGVRVGLAADARSNDLVGVEVSPEGSIGAIGHSPSPQAVLQPGAWEQVELTLDFATGKGIVKTGQSAAVEFTFNTDRQYRAVVLEAIGQPGSATRLTDLRISQRFPE